MLRPLLLFLPLIGPAFGQLRIFESPNEITGSANVSQFVYLNRPGGAQIAGIDPVRKEFVLGNAPSLTDFTFAAVLMENLPENSRVLLAKINEDAEEDLVLLAGDQAYIWTAARFGEPFSRPPDLQFPLPRPIDFTASPAVIADFDLDGADDLLLPGTHEGSFGAPHAPVMIIFSFGKENAVNLALPVIRHHTVKVAPPLKGGTPPMISFSHEYDPSTIAVRIDEDRTVSTVATLPGFGAFADLDADGSAEFVAVGPSGLGLKFSIHQQAETGWEVRHSYNDELRLGWIQDLRLLVADFDGEGRDEVIISFEESESLIGNFPSRPRVHVLKTDGTLEQSRLVDLYGPGFRIISMEAVAAYPWNRVLALRGADRISKNLFGYTLEDPRLGNRTAIRPDPERSYAYLFPTFRRDFLRAWVTDLDGDALPDLLLQDYYQLHRIGGPFPITGTHPSPQSDPIALTDSLLTADLDNDGDDDRLHANFDGISSFRNNGVAGFAPIATFPLNSYLSTAPHRVLGSADFDRDGDQDTLFYESMSHTMGWVENDGNGGFGARHTISLAGRSRIFDVDGTGGLIVGGWQDHLEPVHQEQVVTLDFDQDGDQDIITYPSALGDRLALHRNTLVGFSLEPLTPVLDHWQDFGPLGPHGLPRLNAGRFKATSDPVQLSLFAPGTDTLGNPCSYLRIITSGPGGTSVAEPLLVPYGGAIATADFDGDGLDDFVISGDLTRNILGEPEGTTEIALHRSRGNGTLDPPVIIGKTLGFVTRLMAEDIDDDGMVDLIAASRHTATVEVLHQKLNSGYPALGEWKILFGLDGPQAHEDADHDGVPNLLEYVAGTPPVSEPPSSPLVGAGPGPATVLQGSQIDHGGPNSGYPRPQAILSHPRPLSGTEQPAAIIPESSIDMVTWTASQVTPMIHRSPAHPQWETLIWRMPAVHDGEGRPLPQQFYRFRVTAPLAE